MSNPYDFSPRRLAEFDQWYASKSALIDDLTEKARADIAAGARVSRPEEAALLSGAIRGSGMSREALADLMAVLLVRTIRPDAEDEP